MTLDDFQATFKKLGKLVYLYQTLPLLTADLKTAQAALVDQPDGQTQVNEFLVLRSVIVPTIGPVNRAADSLAKLQERVVAAARLFLARFLAADLGVAATSSFADFGVALASAMTSAGASLQTDNPGGIARFLSSQFGLTLPQSSSPTIPDTYIVADVI